MTLSMTLFTQSYAIGYVVSKFWMRSEWLDVMRVNFNSAAIALVITCSAILTSVAVSLVHRIAPFVVFRVHSSQFILMAARRLSFSLCLVGFYGSNRPYLRQDRSGRAGKGAEFPIAAFLFVFQHKLPAFKAMCGYCHAAVADAFRVCFLGALKAVAANNARFPYPVSIGVKVRSAGAASANCLLAKQGDAWRLLVAIGARLKGCKVAGLTYPVITSVVSAYFTPVFHAPILPQVAKEYIYD
jgi:hypothetical protein